jgi:hypothetical protein
VICADAVYLAGKGITMDTGGVNLKSAAGLPGMSRDKVRRRRASLPFVRLTRGADGGLARCGCGGWPAAGGRAAAA